jgi:hypothetical protein
LHIRRFGISCALRDQDFGAELTPELRAQDERLRAEIGRQLAT